MLDQIMLGFPPKLNVADRGSEIKTTIMVSMPKQKVVKSPANNIEKNQAATGWTVG